MSNVVSSKFGDRQLIHLPPVNMGGDKTPIVPSLAPRGYGHSQTAYPQSRGSTNSFRDRRSNTANIIPKEYAYPSYDGRVSSSVGNQWLGAPTKPYQGNIVPQPGMMPQQQYPGMPNANTNPMPPTAPGMTYTPHAVTQMNQMPVQPMNQVPMQGQMIGQPMQGQVAPVQTQAVPYGSTQTVTVPQLTAPAFQGANPNEKHIFYGPNGEILPGPPQGFNGVGGAGMRPTEDLPRNFSVEGILEYGVLKTLSLTDGTPSFPKIPQFLHAQLRQKYGQFESTTVKIVSTNGEIHVHAVPQVLGGPPVPFPGQGYLPPELEPPYSYRRYRTPAVMERSYPFARHDHAGYLGNFEDDYRETGHDPISELRWKKDDTGN